PRILNITVPQVGHLPLMALRPFFIVSSTPLAISFLALHLTQYPSAIKIFTVRASCSGRSISLPAAIRPRQLGKDSKPHNQLGINDLSSKRPHAGGCCRSAVLRILPVAFRGNAGT